MFQLHLKSLAGLAGHFETVVGTSKGLSNSFEVGGEKINKE